MCSPKAGAGRSGRAGVRLSLSGCAEQAHRADLGLLHLDHHLARADQLGVERLVEVEDRLDAAVVLVVERPPLVAGAGAEDLRDLSPGVGARRLELLLDQVGAIDAVAEGGPELRLERPAGDPAVGRLVGQVADEPAGQLLARRAAAPGRRRGTGRRPSPARRARRRPSRRRRSGPRRSGRARAAPPSPRRPPSARRRRGRRSGRPTAPAARPARRSAPSRPTRPR